MKTPVSSKQRERDFHRSPPDSTAPASKDGNGQAVDPSKPPRPNKSQRRKYLKQYINWLWPFRKRVALNFVLALIVVALDSLWPLGLKMMIDLISGSRSNSPIDPRLPAALPRPQPEVPPRRIAAQSRRHPRLSHATPKVYLPSCWLAVRPSVA
jgi:hypothetical protein